MNQSAYPRSLDETLQSVVDVLFPGADDPPPVTVSTRGSDDDTPLHVVAWRDDNIGAKLLVDAGADVNAQGDMGETPLHVAISRKNFELISLLLKAGADPTLRSEFGLTSIEKAQMQSLAIEDWFPARRGT